MAVLEPILWVLFTLGCVLVSGVILLQEGKGGGLGEAFGGVGAQTFGVRAEGIVKFTGYLAGAIVVIALVITKIRSGSGVGEAIGPTLPMPPEQGAPAQPGAGGAAPADAGGGGAPAAPAPAQGGGTQDGDG